MSAVNSNIQDLLSLKDKDNTLIQDIIQLNLHCEPQEKQVINILNKEITAAKTRLEGLQKLIVFIDCCSNDIILINAFNWMNFCLIQHDSDQLKELKLRITGKIIENAYKNQEFTKKFISDYIAKIVESCLITHENLNETEAALTTLAICMKRYASWFTSYKQKIETFILKFLDNSAEALVEKAAVVFLYLQQVGGAGTDGINHKQNFSSAFHKICVTIHKLFDIFLEHVVELEQYEDSDSTGFTFSSLSCDSEEMIQMIAKRIKNSVKFLKIMLLKAFPVAKEIKPVEILNIINRGTAVHICLTSGDEKSVQDFQLSLFLINIQVILLQLLRIFLFWFQSNSLPFAFNISKILIDCLSRSQNCKCFQAKSQFRETVYKTLSCWMTISKCCLHKHFQDVLISCILKDITETKKEVTLNISDIKNKSTKSKKKFIHEKILASGYRDSSVSMTATDRKTQEQNCLLALDTLKQLLFYSYVDSRKLLEIYSTVINNLINITTSKLSHPYLNQECRTRLYEVLVAFYDQNSPTILPPLQLTIDILNKGTSSRNEKVILCCERGLNVLEKLCQPICPSLHVPEMFHLKSTANKEQKIIVIDENQMEVDIQINNMLEIELNENTSEHEESDIRINENEESDVRINENEQSDSYNVGKSLSQLNIENIVVDNQSMIAMSLNVNKMENDSDKQEANETSETIVVLEDENILNSIREIEIGSKDNSNVNGNHNGQQIDQETETEQQILEHNLINEEVVPFKSPRKKLALRRHTIVEDTEEPPSKLSKLEISDASSQEEVEESQIRNEDFDDSFVDEVKDY